jgi:N-acetylmuramoyl-L-alanine amidase
MAGWYVIEEGDCLSSLARQARLAHWRKIYDHPANSSLRRLRTDPNVIMPGDRVFIPDCEVNEHRAATDIPHQYDHTRDRTRLRIVVADEDGQPYRDYRYKLTVGKQEFKGHTDDHGLIDQEIDPVAETGELTVWWDLPHPLHCKWLLKIGHLDPVEDVSGIQGRLNNLAFDAGPVDNVAGPRTRAAVRRFQSKYKLGVDGIAGPATQHKLKEVHGR